MGLREARYIKAGKMQNLENGEYVTVLLILDPVSDFHCCILANILEKCHQSFPGRSTGIQKFARIRCCFILVGMWMASACHEQPPGYSPSLV